MHYFRRCFAAFLAAVLLFSTALAQQPDESIRYTVDFDYVETLAPGSIAWLYQPNTTINQPVMLSPNMTYYLNHGYSGSYNSTGSIFVCADTVPDFSAPAVTLYGRNNNNDKLFGSLSKYRDPEYYAQHPTLYLIAPEGEYRLDIFAGVRIPFSDDSWQPGENPYELLPWVMENSFLFPNLDYLPTKDDAWALLVTAPSDEHANRYVLYARKRYMPYEGANVYDLHRQEMDLRETQNGPVTVEGVGSWMLYAQDDPLWKRLIFEVPNSHKRRVFGDGGCGPTAVAMAIASVLEPEELSTIGQYSLSPYGYRFCPCSVNENFCTGQHLPYRIETTEQYLRYFPLAVASFCTGNNTLELKGRSTGYGTNMSYLEPLCELMGLSCIKTNKLSQALTFLASGENRVVVTCTAGASSPFTDSSHFLVMGGVDENYLYLLDPMRRDNYARWDDYGFLEVVKPGLVRVELKNAQHCYLGPFFQIMRPANRPAPGNTENTVE